MSSRERILGRVRRALAEVRDEDTPVERAYLREHGARSVAETVDLLAENLADYRARGGGGGRGGGGAPGGGGGGRAGGR
ncbi:hypothetical protein ACFV23_39700, partial [Streptomyces sp. NPDC059627]